MKASNILMIFITIAFIGCTNKSQSNYVTGTFTNESKSEYSIAADTLIITPIKESENSFQIERRTGYQKLRNGITQPKEYKVEKWQSLWDSDKEVLSEAEYGRQIRVSSDGQFLTMKSTQYKRLK